MGCGMGAIKYLLFIFNFIFAVCGLGILTLGVIVQLRITEVTDKLDTNLMFPAITLIVIGSIIFVISFFGCCGAIRESHCMTITFASLLLFILILQIAVAVYAFVVVKNNDNHISVTEAYGKLFTQYGSDSTDTDIVDEIQSSLQCCGVKSKDDFINMKQIIPWSCCGNTKPEPCTGQSFQQGCAQAIKSALTTAGTILGGVAIAIAGVELVGIIFALCLANSIRNTERRGYRV